MRAPSGTGRQPSSNARRCRACSALYHTASGNVFAQVHISAVDLQSIDADPQHPAELQELAAHFERMLQGFEFNRNVHFSRNHQVR
jgi:hypothetical protein